MIAYALPGGGNIYADKLDMGVNVTFGKDVEIVARGKVTIHSNSHIGDRFKANCENLYIGEYFYNEPTDSRGMVIGGGGSNFPWANLTIGNRVTCHTGHINLARSVTIGNGVGLSHDVDIITHGFWNSYLEGFPNQFGEVHIDDGVIIGWKTTILPNLFISRDVVVGSNSVVTKSLDKPRCIYAGNPAKFIKEVPYTEILHKQERLRTVCHEWNELMEHYNVQFKLHQEYPYVYINKLCIDVERMTGEGIHDTVTDAFRDFLRRYGIRVFHPRGFPFKLERIT